MEIQPRPMCFTCFQTKSNCYCGYVQKFNPGIKFSILIHHLEMRRRIASGRMSHLCLPNSELILGHDYTHDNRVNRDLRNPSYFPLLLYPGPRSLNLSQLTEIERKSIIPSGKIPLVFVVDGTWNTARKTVHLSQNLNSLPRICFTPPAPSAFRVRKQPKEECCSTLEAIHYTIELLGDSVGFDVASREHDKLLFVFNKLVERQLMYVKQVRPRHVRKRSF